MDIKVIFGKVFRKVRTAKGKTQESFSSISSRTYVSTVERGVYSITIEKLDELATVLDVHPVTLLYLTYLHGENRDADDHVLLNRIKAEVKLLSSSTQ